MSNPFSSNFMTDVLTNIIKGDTIKFSEGECMAAYSKLGAIKDHLSSLKQDMASISTINMWIGYASRNFSDQRVKLDKELDTIIDKMNTDQSNLLSAIEELNKAEQHVDTKVNSLTETEIFKN